MKEEQQKEERQHNRIGFSGIVLCLIGRPASGKSELARAVISSKSIQKLCYPIKIIDTDEIRLNLFGREFNPENESIVILKKKELIHDFIQQSKEFSENQKSGDKIPLIIVDDMHYLTSMRHDIRSIAENLGAYYATVYLSTPLEICLQWNQTRSKERRVPNAVFEQVERKFDVPGKKYRWDLPDFTFSPAENHLNQLLKKLAEFIEKIIKTAPKLVEIKKNGTELRKDKQEMIDSKNKAEELELMTRRLWGDIIKGKYDRSDMQVFLGLLTRKYLDGKDTTQYTNIDLKSMQTPHETALKLTSPLLEFFLSQRKEFFHWLLKNPSENPTDPKPADTDNLFIFLKSLLYKSSPKL